MATFLVYFCQSGVPATTLNPTWLTLRDTSSQDCTSQAPPITAVGGGWYKFTLIKGTTPWTGGQLVGVIDGGSQLTDSDRYLPVIISEQALERQAELLLRESIASHKAITDSLASDLNLIRQSLVGKRSQEISTGTIRIYDIDETTVLKTLQPDESSGMLVVKEA